MLGLVLFITAVWFWFCLVMFTNRPLFIATIGAVFLPLAWLTLILAYVLEMILSVANYFNKE